MKKLKDLQNGNIIVIKNMDYKIMRRIGYHLNGSHCKVNGFLSDGHELMVTPLESQDDICIIPCGWHGILWEFEYVGDSL